MSQKYTECNRKTLENDLYELYNYCLHNVNNINGLIRWLYSDSESILPGHRLATQRHKFQCFIRYVLLFHPCFWFVLCQSTQLCVFWAFSESSLMQMCYFVFVFMHTRQTLLSLCICSDFQWNTVNGGSKDQNLCLLVEYVTVRTNLGTGGGTKHQKSFLFGSEERNTLVSSDESMLSKCDDVITYATEPLNIQMAEERLYV